MMAKVSRKTRDETRRRLIAAGAAHIARDGLERASVDAIAVDAGYAKGTFYNYFDSKEAMFGAVIAEWARRAADSDAVTDDPAAGTRVRLLTLAEADVRVVREEEAFAKVVIRETLAFRPETYPLVLEHLSPFIGKVAQVLGDGMTSGEIRADRPAMEQALLFSGLLAVAYAQHWGSGGAWPVLDEVPALVVSAFLDGAVQRGET
jgi:AcrR family transcriptional regulator